MLGSLAKALNKICWVKRSGKDNEKLKGTHYPLQASSVILEEGRLNAG